MATMSKFQRPKRPPEQVRFARQLYRLLLRPLRAKPQDRNGYSWPTRISGPDFEDHLYGGKVLAVACVSANGSNFLGFDCDEHMVRRLPIFARVLRTRGLAEVAFVTNGSTPSRGKVIITLANHLPHTFAVEFVQGIKGELISEPDFGEVRQGMDQSEGRFG